MTDRTEIGAYAEAMRPIAERFELNGKMGLDVRLSPDAAVAVAKTMMLLARYVDLMHAHQHASACLRSAALSLAAFGLIIILIVKII